MTAPGSNQYVPLFGTKSPADTAANANSAYGNARTLGANSFGTVAYSGVTLADTAYMVFGFVPVSYVAGMVRQETYGLPVTDAYIGPYTAIGEDCEVTGSEVEHSILLRGARVRNLASRMEASLLGRNVSLSRSDGLPKTIRMIVGDNSELNLP